MKFRKTALESVYIILPEPYRDHRGLFARTFCQQEFAAIGHHKPFVQFNHSLTLQKGTVRGLHYQRPPFAEIKLIRCIRGRVFDVVIDIRKDSPTFLNHIGVELSEQNMAMIYVPEGVAHGFQTLEDDTQLIYHHTAYYTPAAEGGLRFDDPLLHINWPLTPVNVSEKDRNLPPLDPGFSGIVLQSPS